jgi:3-methyladenine DNA glycosylase/8-oxoguanine DNA glycosylase
MAASKAERLASLFGSAVAGGERLTRLFPTPAQLAEAPIERADIAAGRADAIRSLARHVGDGSLALGAGVDARAAVSALGALRGVGEWTAEYVAMRALGEPDAFPSGDHVLRRMTGDLTAAGLTRRANAWRPWRAYAAMLLWQKADDEARRGARASTRDERPAVRSRSSAVPEGTREQARDRSEHAVGAGGRAAVASPVTRGRRGRAASADHPRAT